jgi:PAS domain S-box-containing protein
MSHAAAQLKESDEHFRSLIDAAPMMVWMSGIDGRCTFFNKSWLDFTGLSLEEQLDEDWVARVHPEDRERSVNKYLAALKSRENFSFEYRVLRKEGTYGWVTHNGATRSAADGGFLGYIGTRVDFTDRNTAEEHLRQVSAQRLNAQEIENFRIGHELHESLAQRIFALSTHLSYFSRKYDRNFSVIPDFDQVQHHLRDLCQHIIRLSHQLSPVSVEALGLPAAVRNLCDHAADAQRSVIFLHDENLPRLPEGVSLILYRIVEEALRNAMTHSGASRIHVELSVSATMVSLAVKDNGCGFVVRSISKPGLGLSQMSERMRCSGGGLNIISSPGEGTTIVATMPLRHSNMVDAP